MGKRDPKTFAGSKVTVETYRSSKPSFDETALSALTTKLEKGLGKRKPERMDDSTNSRKQGRVSNSASVAEAKLKTNTHNDTRRPKKDTQGESKTPNTKTWGKKSKPEKKGDREGLDERAMLLQEILALGGTKEDLDLVADVASDEEDDSKISTSGPDKSFQKDLAKFVADLGIEQKSIKEPDSDIEYEDENDNEEVSDFSEGSIDVEHTSRVVVDTKTSSGLDKASTSNGINRLVFEPRADWHATALPSLPKAQVEDLSPTNQETICNLQDYAKSLLDADSRLYASKHMSSTSSHRFLATIMSSGTLADKVSALTLVVQESPVHTTKSFEILLALAKKRSRGQAVTALGALKDLLGAGTVLPTDRRLRSFEAQPELLGILQKHPTSWKQDMGLPGKLTKAHLISWVYEDWLKESYFDMIKVLESWCSDEVEYARSRAVTYVYELLKEKPEQEANLLRLLVNKLGDPDKKIASRTSYLLLQLQVSHPLMKPIIIRSLENEVLLRPNQSSHARYYAINTLNQTILSAKEEDVAKNLLVIYFDLFVSLLKKPEVIKMNDGPMVNRKGQIQGGGAPMGKKAKARLTKEEEAKEASEEVTEKMISAVLTGVNRALPFSKTDDLTLENHMDTLFRITHSSNFNTSVQALMLIEQLATSKHIAIDRFYRTLYESLLDPRLIASSKHALYLNLLFRALRSDLNIKRVQAFAKRLLQIVTLHQPPFVCGVLYLLRELQVIFPGLKTILADPEESDEREGETFRDVPEEGQASFEGQINAALPGTDCVYDGKKRDPEHSNAERSCLWEVVPFLVHFHPSVALFAGRLLDGEAMPPKPDLISHTLSSFLDRFVYRNAKATAAGPRGSSIMQPLSGGENGGVLLTSKAANRQQQPVNSEAFWRKKAEDVAVDEVFFHRYFTQIGKSKQITTERKIRKATMESDEEEVENEDEIWQALVDSRPEVEGGSDDDSGLEELDLDDSDAELSVEDSDIEEDDIEVDVESSDVSGSEIFGEEDESIAGTASGKEADLFAKEVQTAQTAMGPKDEDSKKSRRKKLKSLPTFASADDYAEMLDNDGDEDIGT